MKLKIFFLVLFCFQNAFGLNPKSMFKQELDYEIDIETIPPRSTPLNVIEKNNNDKQLKLLDKISKYFLERPVTEQTFNYLFLIVKDLSSRKEIMKNTFERMGYQANQSNVRLYLKNNIQQSESTSLYYHSYIVVKNIELFVQSEIVNYPELEKRKEVMLEKARMIAALHDLGKTLEGFYDEKDPREADIFSSQIAYSILTDLGLPVSEAHKLSHIILCQNIVTYLPQWDKRIFETPEEFLTSFSYTQKDEIIKEDMFLLYCLTLADVAGRKVFDSKSSIKKIENVFKRLLNNTNKESLDCIKEFLEIEQQIVQVAMPFIRQNNINEINFRNKLLKLISKNNLELIGDITLRMFRPKNFLQHDLFLTKSRTLANVVGNTLVIIHYDKENKEICENRARFFRLLKVPFDFIYQHVSNNPIIIFQKAKVINDYNYTNKQCIAPKGNVFFLVGCYYDMCILNTFKSIINKYIRGYDPEDNFNIIIHMQKSLIQEIYHFTEETRLLHNIPKDFLIFNKYITYVFEKYNLGRHLNYDFIIHGREKNKVLAENKSDRVTNIGVHIWEDDTITPFNPIFQNLDIKKFENLQAAS